MGSKRRRKKVRYTSVCTFRRNVLPRSSEWKKIFQENDDVVERRKCVAYKLYIISSGEGRIISCIQTDGQTNRQTALMKIISKFYQPA